MACGHLREGHWSGSIMVPQAMLRWNPLCHWPESFIELPNGSCDFHHGREQGAPLFRVLGNEAVLLPESFRGSCSFGGQKTGSLPLAVV